MKYKFVIAGIVAGQVVFALAARAQDEQQSGDTVEVVGLRLAQTELEAGTAVSVITAAEMERRGQAFVADAVAAVPGVAESRAGAFGGVSSVRLRGSAVGQTLVLIDGVPVNDAASPGGGYDFGTMDTQSVDRIEVLRGPQSTLWGSDAIGGVVSIVTARPEDGVSWGGFVEGGSYSTWRTGAHLAAGGERSDGGLSIVMHTSDGISKADEADGNVERDPFASFTASGRSGIDLTEAVRVEAFGRWVATEFDFDGFPPPNFVLADSDERSESTEGLIGGQAIASFWEGRFENRFMVAQSEIERRTFSAGVQSGANQGERTTYRYTGDLDIAAGHQAVFGVEREESEADGDSAETNSLFALYEYSPMASLILSGGVRYDDDDRFGSETTGRAALSWHPSSVMRVRATWGQGFKAPTIFQTNFICGFCGLTAPNSSLQAERSEAFDLGIDYDLGFGDLSATVFDQDTENLIDFSFTQGYANIERARQRGVELAFDSASAGPLGVSASYTYLDAEDGSGAALARVPEHAGFVEFSYDPDGPFRGSLMFRYNGEQSDGFGPDVAAWTRADLALGYEVGERVELYGRVENLFDEEYQQVGGYGAPGLSGYVGLRVRN